MGLSYLLPVVETRGLVDYTITLYVVLRPFAVTLAIPLLLTTSNAWVRRSSRTRRTIQTASFEDAAFGLVLALPFCVVAPVNAYVSQQASYSGAVMGFFLGGSAGTTALTAAITWAGMLSLSVFLAGRAWALMQGRPRTLEKVLTPAAGVVILLLLLALQQLSETLGVQPSLVLLPAAALVSIALLVIQRGHCPIRTGSTVLLPALVLGLGQLSPMAFADDAVLAFSLWGCAMSGCIGLLAGGLVASQRHPSTLLAFALPVTLAVPIQF